MGTHNFCFRRAATTTYDTDPKSNNKRAFFLFTYSHLSSFNGAKHKQADGAASANNCCPPLGHSGYYNVYKLGLPSLTTRGHPSLKNIRQKKDAALHTRDSHLEQKSFHNNFHNNIHHDPKWGSFILARCYPLHCLWYLDYSESTYAPTNFHKQSLENNEKEPTMSKSLI